MQIPLDQISPNPQQPRLDDQNVATLAETMAELGLINAIAVQKNGDGWVIVDGERRWLAAKALGWETIEATEIEPLAESTNLLARAAVANIQRQDMTLLEEAQAFMVLMEAGKSQTAIAQIMGVSNSMVSLRLKLLELAPVVQQLYHQQRLPFDPVVIYALARLSHEDQDAVCKMAVARRWKVRGIKLMCARLEKQINNGERVLAAMDRTKKRETLSGDWDPLEMVDPQKSMKAQLTGSDVHAAALKVCQKCALFEDASPRMCRECPLPQFLEEVSK